ncbi:MAG: hypothetical protein JSS53_02920 [Proteobacteria bacterium]|nr:hypothetical protein [Pseudomonadota bacterium]
MFPLLRRAPKPFKKFILKKNLRDQFTSEQINSLIPGFNAGLMDSDFKLTEKSIKLIQENFDITSARDLSCHQKFFAFLEQFVNDPNEIKHSIITQSTIDTDNSETDFLEFLRLKDLFDTSGIDMIVTQVDIEPSRDSFKLDILIEPVSKKGIFYPFTIYFSYRPDLVKLVTLLIQLIKRNENNNDGNIISSDSSSEELIEVLELIPDNEAHNEEDKGRISNNDTEALIKKFDSIFADEETDNEEEKDEESGNAPPSLDPDAVIKKIDEIFGNEEALIDEFDSIFDGKENRIEENYNPF